MSKLEEFRECLQKEVTFDGSFEAFWLRLLPRVHGRAKNVTGSGNKYQMDICRSGRVKDQRHGPKDSRCSNRWGDHPRRKHHPRRKQRNLSKVLSGNKEDLGKTQDLRIWKRKMSQEKKIRAENGNRWIGRRRNRTRGKCSDRRTLQQKACFIKMQE